MFKALFVISTTLASLLSISAMPHPADGAAAGGVLQHEDHSDHSDHSHSRRGALPGNWFHKRDHPVHDLFKRAPGDPLPTVGTPEWLAQYPQGGALPESNIPQAWLDALHAAVQQGLIPTNVPLATSPDGGNTATYPASANAAREPICSSQYQCRHEDDVWDAPDGMIGLSVDDGPSGVPEASARLYDFLKANNQKITHFMIGRNIRDNPTMFLRAFDELGDDIGVHTWTHRHMSLLSNEQLVADLGWTVKIIHDSTGGRVPRYWRPPYGDADNRVRAIAKHIFGLTTVIWNQDSQDWTMTSNRTTLPAIQAAFTGWYNGPRSPGLVILEHEITPDDVTAFINMYPLIATAAGGAPWQALSVAQLFDDEHTPGGNGDGWYLNADDNEGEVTPMDIVDGSAPAVTTTSANPTNTGGNRNGTATDASMHGPTPTTTRSAAVRGVEGTMFVWSVVLVALGALAL
ncbi:glycoside hydrolase/deacetylase [Serendipita vermifera]|nr:glycoside hydrolase/deacetylase [Serendipita vermifera]